jgi:hypothetical protein
MLLGLLERCADRGDAPPRKLVDRIALELNVARAPRSRVHDLAKLIDAARFSAANPAASLSEIAAAVGMPGKKDNHPRVSKQT